MIMPVPALSACARMAALATTLALAGCASMAPPYAPPPLPVAEQYPETDSAGAHAADIAWQAYFADARRRTAAA